MGRFSWTVIFFLAFSTLYYLKLFHGHDPISHDGKTLWITDFSYYTAIVKDFWFERTPDPYSLETGLRVLTHLAGTSITAASPIGLTFTAMLFFVPAVLLTWVSYAFAQTIWVSGWWVAYGFLATQQMRRETFRAALVIAMVVLVISCSASFLAASALGQTSLPALVAFLLLSGRKVSVLPRIVYIFLLLALTIKLHYAIIFVLFLIGERNWKMLQDYFSTGTLGLLVLTLWAGSDWITGYLSNLVLFSSGTPPAVYASVFSFESMNMFRTAFSNHFSPEICLLVSRSVLAVSIGCGLIGALTFSKRTNVWYLVLLSYLLFSPYVAVYEDILIALPVFFNLNLKFLKQKAVVTAFCFVMLTIVLNASLLISSGLALHLWFSKLFCGVLMYVIFLRDPKIHRSDEKPELPQINEQPWSLPQR